MGCDNLGLGQSLKSFSVMTSKVSDRLKIHMMEVEPSLAVLPSVCVKATLRLGSETHAVHANEGILSQQLVSMKEQSMSILKEFITKNNVPNDVPDELDDVSSDDNGETLEKPPAKSKKRK